jgi:hypothetical protein
MCPDITVDGKRLRIPVALHSGYSPDQTNSDSKTVDARKRIIASRYFFPGDNLKLARELKRSLAAAVAGKGLGKGEVSFRSGQEDYLLRARNQGPA